MWLPGNYSTLIPGFVRNPILPAAIIRQMAGWVKSGSEGMARAYWRFPARGSTFFLLCAILENGRIRPLLTASGRTASIRLRGSGAVECARRPVWLRNDGAELTTGIA